MAAPRPRMPSRHSEHGHAEVTADGLFIRGAHECIQQGPINELREAIGDLRDVVCTLERVVGAPPDLDSPGTGMYRILFESKGLSPAQKTGSKPAPSLPPQKQDRLDRALKSAQLALSVLGLVTGLGMAALGAVKVFAWYVQTVPQAAPAVAVPAHRP